MGKFSLAPACVVLFLQAMAPVASAAAENILKNPGFEENLRNGTWYLNPDLAPRGIALQSVFGRHSGRRSLKLIPNPANTGTTIGSQFGLTQLLGERYTNQPLYFGGWLAAEGGSIAVLRVAAVSNNGALYFREVRQPLQSRTSTFFRDIIDIPDDSGIYAIFITCSAMGTTGAAYFDDLFVLPGNPDDWNSSTGKPDPGPDISGIVDVDASKVIRRIPRDIFGTNIEWIWGGQGLIAPGAEDLDPGLVKLAADTGITSLRFPSGFFSDFYHWRNGVGPRAGRPLVFAFPAVGGVLSSNDFGTDEALELAEKIGGQLLITVNAVTGTPEEAAEWVRYVNKDSQRVKYWEVGNELYVNLSAFDPALDAVPPAQYANRYLQYARAMREADPTIKLGAILDFNYGLTHFRPFADWTETVMSQAGPEIDFVSVHNAFAPVIGTDLDYPVRSVYASMLAAPYAVKASLDRLSDLLVAYKGADTETGIVITEWGPLFEARPESRYIDHSKTLGSALYVAHVLKILVEQPRVIAANAFKFLDRLPNGWIGERDGEFVAKAPLYALQLFSRHFGQTAVFTETSSPGQDTRSMGWVDAAPFVPYLEAVSSLGDDGKLYVILINKHFDRNLRTHIRIKDFCPSGPVQAWTLSGTAIDANTGTSLPEGFAVQAQDAYGGRFDQGGPGEVEFTQSDYQVMPGVFDHTIPPHSVVSLAIEGQPYACPEEVLDPYWTASQKLRK